MTEDYIGRGGQGGRSSTDSAVNSGGTSGGSSGGAGGIVFVPGSGATGGEVFVGKMPSIQTPIRMIPGLMNITFYERTGGTAPTAHTFAVHGPELSTRLADPLSQSTSDILGAGTEYYDVYYSNADGTFNLDGSYLTMSGVFLFAQPAGGGLNLAEISLNYSGAPTEYGNYVASNVALGDNKIESSVDNCIDGDLQTHTTMGNTFGTNERLHLTLGFLSSSGQPPPK